MTYEMPKYVFHEQFGEGEIINGMYQTDEEGDLAAADVMFDHGIERDVPAEDLMVMEGRGRPKGSKNKSKGELTKPNMPATSTPSNSEDDEDDHEGPSGPGIHGELLRHQDLGDLKNHEIEFHDGKKVKVTPTERNKALSHIKSMMGPGKNPDARMTALRKLGSNHETFKKMIGEEVDLDESGGIRRAMTQLRHELKKSGGSVNQPVVRAANKAYYKLKDSKTRARAATQEEVDLDEETYHVIHKKSRMPGTVSSRAGQNIAGVTIKDKYHDRKEAEKHARHLDKHGSSDGHEVSTWINGKLQEEVDLDEADQIDEISKEAKKRYLGKAVGDLTSRAYDHGVDTAGPYNRTNKDIADAKRKIKNRQVGIYRATQEDAVVTDSEKRKQRIAAEDVEQVDEKLIGKQKNLDKNRNGKLDRQDFEMLRKESAESKVSVYTEANRFRSVENAVKDIMQQNLNLRQTAKEEEFKRNNPGHFED